MKKYVNAFISSISVAIILSIIFYMYKLFPFGQNSLAWCDMSQQVIPFLLELKDILNGNSSMFLNMQNAGGMNFWGIFLFFISSPFSFLVAFINKSDMSLFMNILVVIKMMCCAFSANVYFINRFKNLNKNLQIILSVTYAFCGYSMMFYQNIVWLDMMFLFPLLLLSVEELINNQKFVPFIIIFSCMIAVNFYLSYMVIIFLIIFMGVYSILNYKKQNIKNNICLFALSSAVSFAITCSIWLPSFFQYLESARAGNIVNNIAQGSFLTQIYTTLPFIFCTPIILVAVLFLNFKKISNNLKCFFIVFVLTLIPVVIDPINKLWHTGSYMAFPVRYGYITVFIGLVIVAMIFNEIFHNENSQHNKYKKIVLLGMPLAMFLLSILTVVLFSFKKVTAYTKYLWGNKTSFLYLLLIAAISFMCCFLYFYTYKKKIINTKIFIAFVFALTILQCFFNACVYIGSASNNVVGYKEITGLSNKIDDDSFYRLKLKQKYFAVNMLGGIGYNCLDHYTSLTSKDYLFAMKKLGYSSYWMEVSSVGGTKFTDMLLSNKYTVKKSTDVLLSDDIVFKNATYCIVKNEVSLPLCLKVHDSDLSLYENMEHKNRFSVQEDLFKMLFNGMDSPFHYIYNFSTQNTSYISRDGLYTLTKVDPTEDAYINYNIKIDKKSTLYFDCFRDLSNRLREPINNSFTVTVNGKQIEGSYPNQKNNGILELGTFEDENVNISVKLLKNICCKSFGVCALELDKLMDAANNTECINFNVNNNSILGEVVATQEDFLYINVPYNKGITVKINGETTQAIKVNDAFIAIKLQEGYNKIEVKFIPKGFIQGAVVSFVGICLFTLIVVFYKHKNKELKLNKNLSSLIKYIFYFLFASTVLVIYVLPIIIYIIF